MTKNCYVLNIPDRTNAAGQSAECLRCFHQEFALDRTGIAGQPVPSGAPEHVVRLRYAVFATQAAHQAGKPHDPSAMLERDIDIAAHPDLAAAFEQVFAAIMAIEAQSLGATVGEVSFELPDPVVEEEIAEPPLEG